MHSKTTVTFDNATSVAAQTAQQRVTDSLNKAHALNRLNCFIDLFDEQAMREAQTLEADSVASEIAKPLFGVPFAAKDIFNLSNRSPTAGSKFNEWPKITQLSPILKKLKHLGAIQIGAANLDEICYGMTGLNPHFGHVRNPLNEECIAGGSSSGSAAAVAAGIVPFAIGSDTGGSIRVPAALCGVIGFKPSLGLLSTQGAVALSTTQDCIGLLSKSVHEIEQLMTLLIPNNFNKIADGNARPLRIGICEHPYFQIQNFELHNAWLQWCETMLRAKIVCKPIAAEFLSECDESATFITGYEAAQWHAERITTSLHLFSKPTQMRLERACSVSTTDYNKALTLHQRYVQNPPWPDDYDLLMAPTLTCFAPKLQAISSDSQAGLDFTLAALKSTRTFSFLGGPAISLPMTPTSSGAWGVQLIARPGKDGLLLSSAKLLESLHTNDR